MRPISCVLETVSNLVGSVTFAAEERSTVMATAEDAALALRKWEMLYIGSREYKVPYWPVMEPALQQMFSYAVLPVGSSNMAVLA